MDANVSLAENKAFAERIFDRIKDGLGDLMSDAELKVLLDRAIEEAFFKPRRTGPDYNPTHHPPYFVEMVRDLMKEAVEKQVKEHFTANAELIKEQVAETLQQGIGQAVLKALAAQWQDPLFQLEHNLRAKGLL